MFSRVAFGYPSFSHNRARTNRRTKATKWMSGIMAANYARSHALKHSIVKRKQGENKNRIHLLPLYCFRKPHRLCPAKWQALERAATIILWHEEMSKRRTLIACGIGTEVDSAHKSVSSRTDKAPTQSFAHLLRT